MLLLALTTKHTRPLTSRSPWAAGAASVATVALVAVVAPPALGANGWGLIPRFATPTSLDTTSRLNLALDLRNSLTANTSAPKIVYRTSGKRPAAFRLYTLIDFNGAEWTRPQDDPSARVRLDSGVQWPERVDDWADRTLDRVRVEVLSQAEESLPLPPVPRTVTVDAQWSYSPVLDQVTSKTATTQGLTYEFLADLDYFTGDGLRALGDASGNDARLDPRYLAVADTVDLDRVRTLAQQLVGDSATRYDRAVALQEYFRDPQEVTYATSVTPSGDDSVSVFLSDRSGYCVQFATAMIVLARSLGIPARMAVGFLPGERGADGQSVIRGTDAHAWPEVYFAGAGWVRFEPTPAVRTGARPSYADPTGTDTLSPFDEFAVPGYRPTLAPRTASRAHDAAGVVDRDSYSAEPVWCLWWAVAIVVIGFATAWRFAYSRRATAARVEDPERVWAWLRTRLPREHGWPDTLTPHEAEAHLRALGLAQDGFLSAQADGALSRVALAVSHHRYTPQGSTQPIHSVWDDARIVAA